LWWHSFSSKKGIHYHNIYIANDLTLIPLGHPHWLKTKKCKAMSSESWDIGNFLIRQNKVPADNNLSVVLICNLNGFT
jgi:hypothetical protein